VVGCTHFSFFEAMTDCHLQDAYAVKQAMTAGFVTGPFSCWGAVDHHAYANIGNATYLPKEIACLEMGVLYSPIQFVTKWFPPKGVDGEADGLESLKKCQEHCLNTKGCLHFTLMFPGGMCRLSGEGARALQDQNVVSGPRGGCKGVDFMEVAVKAEALDPIGHAAQPYHNYAVAVGCGLFVLGAACGFSTRFFRMRRGVQLAEQEDDALLAMDGESIA